MCKWMNLENKDDVQVNEEPCLNSKMAIQLITDGLTEACIIIQRVIASFNNTSIHGWKVIHVTLPVLDRLKLYIVQSC